MSLSRDQSISLDQSPQNPMTSQKNISCQPSPQHMSLWRTFHIQIIIDPTSKYSKHMSLKINFRRAHSNSIKNTSTQARFLKLEKLKSRTSLLIIVRLADGAYARCGSITILSGNICPLWTETNVTKRPRGQWQSPRVRQNLVSDMNN
jgi:hypothetical protein